MWRRRKMTAHSCCLSLSAVSHLNEQSLFPAVTPINIWTASMPLSPSFFLSSYSVSWSSRPASRAKTWTSCVLASARAPQPPSPSQILTPNVASTSFILCISVLKQSIKNKKLCHTFWKKRSWDNQSTRCLLFGINTHQFLRLLFAKYPPCG